MNRRLDHEELLIGRLVASAIGLALLGAGYGLYRLVRWVFGR